MLYEEIDKLISKIKLIEPIRDCNLFLESMTRNNAKVIKSITSVKGSSHMDLIALSTGCINRLIVPLPEIIKKILEVVRDPETPTHISCTLIGALAYFVQPNDLIPDDAKGGYGFVDDSVLIHAAFSEYLLLKGEKDELNQWKNLSVLAAGVCPPNILKPLATAVKDITAGFYVYAKLPPEILKEKIRKVTANPYQPVTYKSVPEIKNQFVESWSPFVNVNKAKNLSFEYNKGKFEANFDDGSKITVK